MTPPSCCQVCGLPLPEVVFPGVQTCRGWADTVARKRGDLLPRRSPVGENFMLASCRLFAAIREGREPVGEP
jgi:hypothetical protein